MGQTVALGPRTCASRLLRSPALSYAAFRVPERLGAASFPTAHQATLLIYALPGTWVERRVRKGHVPHISPPADPRGTTMAAWPVQIPCLSPGPPLFAELPRPPLLPVGPRDRTQYVPDGLAHPCREGRSSPLSAELNETRVTDQHTCVAQTFCAPHFTKLSSSWSFFFYTFSFS